MKFLAVLLTLCFCISCAATGEVSGALFSREKDPASAGDAPPADDAKIVTEKNLLPAETIAKMKEMAADKREYLEGTNWNITLTAADGRTKAGNDIVSFRDGKVSAKSFEAMGYAPTDFTLRAQEDGVVTWETAQNSEKDGVLFWLGTIEKDGAMSGVISKRDKKNNAKNYRFSGSQQTQ